jgi:hypothetical protein
MKEDPDKIRKLAVLNRTKEVSPKEVKDVNKKIKEIHKKSPRPKVCSPHPKEKKELG